ncbi:hypothetical protein CCACVL1_26275 [Corchorus capsularis]|uniref:Uncharacterized protein n=1 Tax=Corchorus capsularis TaxID=210143 RepID=A0A1R3GFC3_COCAP|nr:hypothetical protein CCACVL1_26275 [Corchorus capsularis]
MPINSSTRNDRAHLDAMIDATSRELEALIAERNSKAKAREVEAPKE